MLKNIFLKTAYLAVAALMISGLAACRGNHGMNNNNDFLYGRVTHRDWLDKVGSGNYNYTPDQETVAQIQNIMHDNEVQMTIFAGSWCPDSKAEVPRILSLMDHLNMPADHCPIYAMDYDKHDPDRMGMMYDVTNVPTVVVMMNGNVMGKIVEHPKVSWEKDILNCLQQ